MNNLSRKIFSILFLIILFSLLINFFRQVLVYRRISRHLLEEKEELQALEKRNRELKMRLEEVKKQEFFEEQGGSAFNLEGLSPTSEPEMASYQKVEPPNFKKWWRLFFY